MSERVNLSFGLRWEVNPAPSVTQGLKPYTIQGSGPSTWTLAPQGTPLWQTAWYNFAPRLGAAYLLNNKAGRETVLRAGGGVFFDTGQQLGSFGFTGPGFSALGKQQAISFPGNPAAILHILRICRASATTVYTSVECQHRAGTREVTSSHGLLRRFRSDEVAADQ